MLVPIQEHISIDATKPTANMLTKQISLSLSMFADNSFLVICLHPMLKRLFAGMLLKFAPAEADLVLCPVLVP